MAASLLIPCTATIAAEPPPATEDITPDRLTLECVEQPSRQVTFDGEGRVDYSEAAPPSQEPVRITAIKTEPGQDYPIAPARIESTAPWLERTQATWTRGQRIDADNGRLHIDLVDSALFLTEAGTDGNARFRRFDCKQVAEDISGGEPTPASPER
ncbi:hypothetical protein CCR91_04100 [Thiorhodovibrio winogradskyi]|nr:hypothetical protein [Thiorhodovibrio winogradskyi]